MKYVFLMFYWQVSNDLRGGKCDKYVWASIFAVILSTPVSAQQIRSRRLWHMAINLTTFCLNESSDEKNMKKCLRCQDSHHLSLILHVHILSVCLSLTNTHTQTLSLWEQQPK